MGAQKRSSRIWLLAGAALALLGAGAYAAQNAGPKPPALTYSGPVPSKFSSTRRKARNSASTTI